MDVYVTRKFLLMGKTGEGKSATGNTLLDRKYFKTSAISTSVTKEVDYNFATFENYSMRVVDTPGLVDTEINQITEDKRTDANSAKAASSRKRAKELEAVVKDMNIALKASKWSVHAFLLVVRFGSRFTKENIETVESLETIFGPEYIKRVVVVMTCGDLFKSRMEEDGRRYLNFHEWCRSQKGALKELYDKCKGRFVLFNNIERDGSKKRQQVLELLKIVDHMIEDKGSYFYYFFEQAAAEREKLILTLKVPHLKLEIQSKVDFLSKMILLYYKDTKESREYKDCIEKQILDLREEIVKQDKNSGLLQEMLDLANVLHRSLNNVTELKKIARDLEEIRRKQKQFSNVGTAGMIGSGVVFLVNPVAGLAAAVGTSLSNFLPRWMLRSEERNLEKIESEYKKKLYRDLNQSTSLRNLATSFPFSFRPLG